MSNRSDFILFGNVNQLEDLDEELDDNDAHSNSNLFGQFIEDFVTNHKTPFSKTITDDNQ